MDYFGINSTADLPKISEVLMEELVQATIVNNQPLTEKYVTEDIAEINQHNNFEHIDVAEEEKEMELNEDAVLLIEEEMLIDENEETFIGENNEEKEISINDKQEDSNEYKQLEKLDISVFEEEKQDDKKEQQSES